MRVARGAQVRPEGSRRWRAQRDGDGQLETVASYAVGEAWGGHAAAGVELAQHRGSSGVRSSGSSISVGDVCPDVFVCLSGAAGSHDDPDCILETCLKHSLT